MIIGITGTDGGGKGTAVEYLVEKKGFIHCSARALWIDEIHRQGIEVNRANMRIVANELRAAHGDDFLIMEYKRRTGFTPEKNYVVESLRATAEVASLKKEGGILWAVDANPHIRYERIQSRASESDQISFEEFLKHEGLEMNDPDPHGMQKGKVIALADVVLQNNSTPGDLYLQIEKALAGSAIGIVNSQNYLAASLDDWQTAFYALYGHIDDKRSLDSIWRHSMVNASKFSSDIRKNNFGLAFTHLAHIFCWTVSFAERCRRSDDEHLSTIQTLADMVWEKYPGICPYCGTNPCSCSSPGLVQKDGNALVIPKGDPTKRPATLDDWGRMFDYIYSNAHAVIPIEALAFHLVEETGEVTSQLIRITEMLNGATSEEKKRELFREVADVFSWVCSVVSKINKTYFYPAARHFEKETNVVYGSIPTATLSKILWDEYGSLTDLICSTCKTNPCSCDQKLRL